MNPFFETILNLRRFDKDKALLTINQVVHEELEKVLEYVSNMEGLCKVVGNNIKVSLDEKGITNKLVNIKDLGAVTEHLFLLVHFIDNDNQQNYILIDPTYRQFLSRKGSSLHFKEWPAALLKQKNPKLLQNLLDFGYSLIDQHHFENYMQSFDINMSLENIVLENYKEVPNETIHKNFKR